MENEITCDNYHSFFPILSLIYSHHFICKAEQIFNIFVVGLQHFDDHRIVWKVEIVASEHATKLIQHKSPR